MKGLKAILVTSFLFAGSSAFAHSDYYRCVVRNPTNYLQVCGSREHFDRTGRVGPDYGYGRGGWDRGYDRGYGRGGWDRGYDRGYGRGGWDRGYGRGGWDRGYGRGGGRHGGWSVNSTEESSEMKAIFSDANCQVETDNQELAVSALDSNGQCLSLE